MIRTLRRSNPIIRILPLLLGLLGMAVPVGGASEKPAKDTIVDMKDFFLRGDPLSTYKGMPNAAQVETTIRHQVYFSDFEGNNSAWSVINYRQGQPNAWHLVTGTHACVGTSWWCGVTGLPFGDGYDNNWVQSLKTAVPINLTGTNNNKLTFKYKVQTEDTFDLLWVLMKGSDPGAHYDTLFSFTGNFGTNCSNASIDIPDSFVTSATQPVELRFLFGSDLTFSAGDDGAGVYVGCTLDDIKITGQGNDTRFFDDMESGSSKWIAESPNPGPLWHVENSPGTSIPASCFFLSTNVWVPFQGSGFGLVPDFCDAMLVSPPMDLKGAFSPNVAVPLLRVQFDNWINMPQDNYLFWSLFVSGSNDLTTWTLWTNPFGTIISGDIPQCTELQQMYREFDPYNIISTGIPPGTRYIRVGFRLRDLKATASPAYEQAGPLKINYNTEGVYFDNIGVYHIYTITGVEAVSATPAGSRAAIRKVYPNPFNPHTTIEFSVPTAGPVAVRLFDIHGKEVTTVVNTSMSPGIYRARWDGRDAKGSDVASGVYFASIQSHGTRDTARLMLLK